MEPFVYRIAPLTLDSVVEGTGTSPVLDQTALGRSAYTAEEIQGREAAAYQKGLLEGQQKVRAEADQIINEARESVIAALRDFAAERESYYRRVEAEVLSLALAIARKILHRESQVDSLMLAGAVRVALDKITAGSTVELRVSPAQAAEWRAFFAHLDTAHEISVTEDTKLYGTECFLKTDLAVTDLSVETQLKEIERGLMDLLVQSPRKSP